MRSARKSVWVAIATFFLVTSITSVMSCQIGLGASVDTEAPTLKITYPPSSAVIKGSFTFAGTCDDDLGVTAIAVTVTNTESSKTWSYDAEVDNKNWHVLNMNEADASAASGYKFPDGKYEISVVASDAAGHTSGTSSRSFEIDNTAPLFVIKGPGSGDITSPTAYGSVFTVTGTIADDHAPIASMKVTILDKNNTVVADTENNPYKFTNIETSGGTSVTIARYTSTGQTGDVYTRYTDIYGTNPKAGTQEYYCEVQLTDTAKEYTNPSESSNLTLGNTTSTVYLNDDVYTKYLSSAGLNLQASDIKKIVNGTFTGTTTNGDTLTSTQIAEVRNVFKPSDGTPTSVGKGITKVAFSLNADASPKFDVGGLKFNTTTDTTNPDNGKYNIDDNQSGAAYKLSVTATAGRNGTYVNPKTLRVYMFGPFDTLANVAANVDAIYNDVKTYAGDNGTESYYDTNGVLTNGRGYILKNEKDHFINTNDYTSSTVESYSYQVSTPTNVVSGNYYLIAATGTDADNIELTHADGYSFGFKGANSTNPPTVTMDAYSAVKPSVNIANQGIYNTSNISFSGKANAVGGSTIANVKWSVAVIDESDNNATVGTITGYATATDGDYDEATEDWNFSLSSGTNYSSYKAELNSDKLYMYDVTIAAFDKNNAQSANLERYIHVDTKKPTVSIDSVTPVVVKNSSNCVNGKITVTPKIDDTNLKSVSYVVYCDGAQSGSSTDLGAVYAPKVTIDTTSLTDTKPINIKFTATDKAGNSSSCDTTTFNSNTAYLIDQSTDAPVVSFGNATGTIDTVAGIKTAVTNGATLTNLFDPSNNNKLSINISDDDGIKDVVINSRTAGIGTYAKIGGKEDVNSTSLQYTYVLSTEGAFDLQIVVTDTANASTYSTTTSGLTIAVDAGAPVFSNVSTDRTYYKGSDTIAARGTVTDSSGVVTLKSNGTGSAYATEKGITSGTEWTDSITVSGTEGAHSVMYTAVDKYGQSTTNTISYTIDTTMPVVVAAADASHPFKINDAVWSDSVWYKAETLPVVGYYTENGSGLAKIYYYVKTSAKTLPTDLSATHDGFITLTNSTGSAVAYNVTAGGFDGSDNQLLIQAQDAAGNLSSISTYNVHVDQEAPEFASKFCTFDGTSYKDAGGTVLANGQNDMTLYGTIKDAASGVSGLTFTIAGTDSGATVTYTTAADVTTFDKAKSATYAAYSAANKNTITGWKAVIAKAKLSAGGEVKATPKDTAGNGGSQQIFALTIDKDSPEVVVSSTYSSQRLKKVAVVNGATTTDSTATGTVSSINGTATFVGTATDNFTLSSVSVYTSLNDSTAAITTNDTLVGTANDTSAYSWSFTKQVTSGKTMLSNGGTLGNTYTGSAETAYIKILATDSAANQSIYVYQYTVDPNADRPIFNVTNIDGNNGVMKYDTVLTGTISDDDGISDACVLKVYEQTATQNSVPTTSAAWSSYTQTGTCSFNKTTGDWSYAPISAEDGTKTLYLYFKDAKGTEFWTNYNASGNSAAQNKINMPQVEYKRLNIADNTTALVYKTDGTSPVIKTAKLEYSADQTNWTEVAFTATGIVGGASRRYVRLTFTAADSNGIKNMTIGVKDAASNTIAVSLSGTANTTSADTTWTSGIIDLGGANSTTYTSGTAVVTASVIDQSNLSGGNTYNFTIDNIAPDTNQLTINAPETTTSGSNKISSEVYTGLDIAFGGIASDTGGAGMKSVTGIQWLVPTSTQAAASDAVLAADTSWGGKLAANSTSTAWKFVFNGSDNADLRTYTDLYATTYAGTITENANVYSIPIYLRLTDDIGNVSIYRNFILKFNPHLGWPKTYISYPATGATVGGEIRVNGFTTDLVGSASSVFVQVDLDNDGDYYDDDKENLAAKGYTIWTAGTGTNQVDIGNTLDNKQITDTSIVKSVGWWGIKAEDAVAWSLSLNSNHELDPSSGTVHNITMRAIAVDSDKNAGLWSNEVALTVDTGAPEIGKSVQSIVQASSSKSYETTGVNYISGAWSLKVSVEDNEKIKKYSVQETVGSGSATTLTAGTGYTVSSETTYTTDKDGVAHTVTTGYTLTIPINHATEGTVKYYIYTEDNSTPVKSGNATFTFYVDSTAPAFDTTYGIAGNGTKLVDKSTPVQNSNGAFALSTKIKDEGSGFDKLAFFYYRSGTKTGVDKVYDPLLSTSSTTIYTTAANKSAGTLATGIAKADSLFGLDCSTGGTRDSTTTFKHSGIKSNAHIRKGGLIKIGGVYRTISAVDTTNGIVTFSSPVDTSFTTAFIPYAQVVDSTYSETLNEDGTLGNDSDGDGMYEMVSTQDNKNWTLTGTTNSTYIPDGNIIIYCVAFDKAGNISSTSLTTQVQNNPLKLTKIYLATDLNGNGSYDATEYETYARAAENMANTTAWNLETKQHASLDAENNIVANNRIRFIVKNSTNALAVIPETTGGNNITTTTPLNYIFGDGTLTAAKTGTTAACAVLSNSSNTGYGLSLAGGKFTSGDTLTSTVRSAASSGHTVNVTFYDNTDETTPGDTTNPSLAAYVNVTLDIDLVDDMKPTATFDPFHWTSLTDNSVYDSANAAKKADLKGHIELESDWTASGNKSGTTGVKDGDPKVSGLITLTGTSYDETRLSEIDIGITGIKLNGGTAGASTKLATYNTTSGNWDLVNSTATVESNGWKFQVLSNTIDQGGHTAKWQLDIDTSKVYSGTTQVFALADVSADVLSKDATANTSTTSSTNTVSGTPSPHYRMDIVPYMKGIARNSSYNTYRTRSGAVALLRGETLNTITGFNIAYTTNTSLVITSDRAGSTITTAATAFGTPTISGSNLQFTVPAAAKSGYLLLTVNSVPALNNLNAYTAYNTEDTTQLYDRTTLSDDRYVQIWRVNAADTFKSSSNAVYPAMAKATDGTLFASFSNYSSATVNYASFAAKTEVFYTYDPPEETDLCVTGSGTGGQVNVLYSANYQGGTASSWTSNSNDAGGLYCYDDSVDTIWVGRDNRRVLRFELFYHNQMLQQFKNFRVKRAGTAASDLIHVAYYDKITNSIHYSNTVENYSMDATTEFSWVNIDGGTDSDDSGTYSDGSSVSLTAARFTGTTRCTGTGDSVALALTSTKYPVIVYYDASNGVLKLARASATNPKGNVSKWTVQDVLGTSDPNYGTQVSYISAEIDSSGYLHIAFQNMKNQLVYIKSTNAPTNGTTAYTFGTSQTIDDSGTYIDLALNGTTPYISYLGRINSYDGMKIAYYDSSLDFNNDGTAEGGWETMTAPLNQKVTNVRSCIETQAKAADNNTYAAAIGFYPGADYRAAFFVGN